MYDDLLKSNPNLVADLKTALLKQTELTFENLSVSEDTEELKEYARKLTIDFLPETVNAFSQYFNKQELREVVDLMNSDIYGKLVKFNASVLNPINTQIVTKILEKAIRDDIPVLPEQEESTSKAWTLDGPGPEVNFVE